MMMRWYNISRRECVNQPWFAKSQAVFTLTIIIANNSSNDLDWGTIEHTIYYSMVTMSPRTDRLVCSMQAYKWSIKLVEWAVSVNAPPQLSINEKLKKFHHV